MVPAAFALDRGCEEHCDLLLVRNSCFVGIMRIIWERIKARGRFLAGPG